MTMIVVVIGWSKFIFHGSRMGQGKGVESFRLVPEKQGIGASFRLELVN
jgi:hypothetical protein